MVAVVAVAVVSIISLVAVIIVIVVFIFRTNDFVRDRRAHQESATTEGGRVCTVGEAVIDLSAQSKGRELIAGAIGQSLRGRQQSTGNAIGAEENIGLQFDTCPVGIGE